MPCVILEAPADLFEKGCQDVHPDFKAVIPHHGPWPFDLLVRIAKNPTVGINNCIEVRDSCEARGPGFIVSTVERRDGQGQGEPIVSQMTLGFQQIKLFPKSLLKKIHEALMTKSPIRNALIAFRYGEQSQTFATVRITEGAPEERENHNAMRESIRLDAPVMLQVYSCVSPKPECMTVLLSAEILGKVHITAPRSFGVNAGPYSSLFSPQSSRPSRGRGGGGSAWSKKIGPPSASHYSNPRTLVDQSPSCLSFSCETIVEVETKDEELSSVLEPVKRKMEPLRLSDYSKEDLVDLRQTLKTLYRSYGLHDDHRRIKRVPFVKLLGKLHDIALADGRLLDLVSDGHPLSLPNKPSTYRGSNKAHHQALAKAAPGIPASFYQDLHEIKRFWSESDFKKDLRRWSKEDKGIPEPSTCLILIRRYKSFSPNPPDGVKLRSPNKLA